MLKGILIICISALVLLCSIANKQIVDNITTIKISTISPDQAVENEGVSFIYDFYITYYGKYRIYELPYHKTYEINNILIYDSTKFEIFICDTVNRFGFLLKNPSDSLITIKNTDSILKTRALGGNWDMADVSKEMKVKSEQDIFDNNGKLILRYIFDDVNYDSGYFHFNKALKDIPFSFSKSLDSTYQSKLYKIQMFIKHDNLILPENLKEFYINSFAVDKTQSPVANDLKTLFNRYIRKEKENHFK